jgi:hypothetical protein
MIKIAKKMPPKGLKMYFLGFTAYSTVTKTGVLSSFFLLRYPQKLFLDNQ